MKLAGRIAGETIETAAINLSGVIYTLPRPARHCDVMRHIWDNVSKEAFVGPEAQGFVTSTGRFVRRRAALRIVKRAGQQQIDHPALNAGGQLFSEDLW